MTSVASTVSRRKFSSMIGTYSERQTIVRAISSPLVGSLSFCSRSRNFYRRRCLSSTRRKTEDLFKADGLPFTISPEDASAKFYQWAHKEQGLRYILRPNSVRLSAAYCPVWSFDLNVRFVVTDSTGRRKFGWKPNIFQAAYGSQPVIYIPGLSAYSGYSYRRSLLNPLHNISLVFLGNQTVPFGKWMLRDMKLANGEILEIIPDPWNSPMGRALAVVKEELAALASESPYPRTELQTEVVTSRRVYMPTYVFEYRVLGARYMAFVSGCDAGVGVSGESHKVFGDVDSWSPSEGFLNQAFGHTQAAARVLGPRGVFAGLQLLLGLAGRLLIRIPIIAAFAAGVVGFRKVLQPFVSKYLATAAWERQREQEATMDDFSMKDSFVDSGTAQSYFEQNRGRILSRLSATSEHVRGNYDWYESWEAWARQQYQKQQQNQTDYRQQQNESRRQQTYSQRARAKQEFSWDFDSSDPYAVLGIKPGATMADVSAAYRKQMLTHHPDVQAGKSEAEMQRAIERTKLINDAYRKLKMQMKR